MAKRGRKPKPKVEVELPPVKKNHKLVERTHFFTGEVLTQENYFLMGYSLDEWPSKPPQPIYTRRDDSEQYRE